MVNLLGHAHPEDQGGPSDKPGPGFAETANADSCECPADGRRARTGRGWCRWQLAKAVATKSVGENASPLPWLSLGASVKILVLDCRWVACVLN